MKEIVNVSKNWGIGLNGDLLINIPADMKYFRETTKGAVVIMGSTTLASFPGGKPLKGRTNIVLIDTDDKKSASAMEAAASDRADGTATELIYVHSPSEAAELGYEYEKNGRSVFVIGGASVYKIMLKYCDECLITINNTDRQADTFFPDLSVDPSWEMTDEGEKQTYENVEFSFTTWKRKERPIGVFDSGVGGLTVFSEIAKKLPKEKVIYFGDTLRVPYGDKDPSVIIGFSRQIVSFLRSKNVKAIVIACNTTTAPALPLLQAENDIPIIGVIKPGAVMAANITKNNKIGVIATTGTITSGKHASQIKEIKPEAEVYGMACPQLVPLIESGKTNDPETKKAVEGYLESLLSNGIDTLILGCTHYPLIREIIEEIAGPGVTLINPAEETVAELEKVLKEKGIEEEIISDPEHEYYCSGDTEQFKKIAEKVMPCRVKEVKKVDIEKY